MLDAVVETKLGRGEHILLGALAGQLDANSCLVLSDDEQLIRLNRTMETTLASFPDPIFVLNHAGLIELRNPAAEDLSSHGASSLLQ